MLWSDTQIVNIGTYGPFAIFAIVSTGITVDLFFALPEIKSIAIEHMDQLFARHWDMTGVRKTTILQDRLAVQEDHGFKEDSQHVEEGDEAEEV